MTIRDSVKNDKQGTSSKKHFLANSRFLTFGFSAIGALVLFSGLLLGKITYGQNLPNVFLGITMALSFPWVMGSCLMIIIKKEVPRLGMPSITGKLAVFQGVFCLSILVIAELYIIYLILTS